jgi:hypothetical protein
MRPGRIQKSSVDQGAEGGRSSRTSSAGVAGLQKKRVRRRSGDGKRPSTAAAVAAAAPQPAPLAKRSCDTHAPKQILV